LILLQLHAITLPSFYATAFQVGSIRRPPSKNHYIHDHTPNHFKRRYRDISRDPSGCWPVSIFNHRCDRSRSIPSEPTRSSCGAGTRGTFVLRINGGLIAPGSSLKSSLVARRILRSNLKGKVAGAGVVPTQTRSIIAKNFTDPDSTPTYQPCLVPHVSVATLGW
jgi:hypothetical protein